MTETQLRQLAAFQTLPIYDESDERSHSLAAGAGGGVRECATRAEVEECLADPRLVPLGAVRVGGEGRAVVVYFGRTA